MAAYINTGNDAFVSVLNGEYVDKTGLIALINDTLFTEKRFSCVSRPRRFGKSMAAKMLCAYYDRSCSSRHLFRGLEIEAHPDFEKHLTRYPVIYADMTSFTTRFHHDDAMVDNIQQMLIRDIA